VAKAGDVDASAAEAVKSGSAETAAQRSCTETAHPAAEATDCTTAETATTKPAAAEPASMTTGEPTPSVTTTTSSVTTTAPSVAAATAATPACKGINRSKGECSTDRGGDGNSDDCFSKHGKFPLWNDLPDRNNLVAATEQRLNVNITIARSGARFAASLCALLIGGVTFDGSTKDAVQCDVRDALVALKALQRKRSVLVSRTRRPMGAQGPTKVGSRATAASSTRARRRYWANPQALATEVQGLTRQTVYRIQADPAGAEAALATWGV